MNIRGLFPFLQSFTVITTTWAMVGHNDFYYKFKNYDTIPAPSGVEKILPICALLAIFFCLCGSLPKKSFYCYLIAGLLTLAHQIMIVIQYEKTKNKGRLVVANGFMDESGYGVRPRFWFGWFGGITNLVTFGLLFKESRRDYDSNMYNYY